MFWFCRNHHAGEKRTIQILLYVPLYIGTFTAIRHDSQSISGIFKFRTSVKVYSNIYPISDNMKESAYYISIRTALTKQPCDSYARTLFSWQGAEVVAHTNTPILPPHLCFNPIHPSACTSLRESKTPSKIRFSTTTYATASYKNTPKTQSLETVNSREICVFLEPIFFVLCNFAPVNQTIYVMTEKEINLLAQKIAKLTVKELRADRETSSSEEMVGVKEAARILCISESHLRRIKERFPHTKAGEHQQGRLMFVRSKLLPSYLQYE